MVASTIEIAYESGGCERRPVLEDFGSAFFKHADAMAEALGGSELMKPARRFVHVFEGEAKRTIVHGNKPFGAQVLKNLDGFVGAHVDVAERFGPIGADGQEGDLGREVLADLLEAVEVGAGAPMFAGRERYLPVAMGKALPPVELDDALESEVAGEVAHAPGHDADFGVGQFAEGRFVEMVEMGMGEEGELHGREVFD